MQRATRAGDRWSGHVAFPGGKNEKDETDVDTVVRETVEEIGLDLNSKDFIPVGRLDDREITSAQDGKLLMMLSPFVYLQVSPQTPNIKLQTSEVASIHWVPLKFFLSTEPYNFRPMKIKLMKKMPPYLRSMAPVAQELFGDMEVPAIDLPDSDPAPRLWGLTLGMTSQLIDMTEESISGRPHRSKSQKQLTFVKLDKSPPKYTYPDIAALVWLFYRAGLAWEKMTGTTPKHRVRSTSWAAAPELRVYFAALRKALAVAGLLRVGGVVFMAMKLYNYLKGKRA
ncbi:nudix (nucleoside diphosphate linked moiety X)-type motif 8, variant 3 [Umbelopsis sp. WA50703]